MLRAAISRLRRRFAVEDPDERIEGSGEAITSPQHRRSAEAEAELDRLEELGDDSRGKNS
ncbi:hypothetical protein [Natrialba sp. SSL1]|uniref:hypothetical protein n=1 Tax=Natrialba sp. SSL1 TaxID=1869245 RepID=UPI0008F94690|nr:hypothetical protein [Natrialba sp. SSL1]OIB57446.1 hypothetical protein BBD46_11620 [Natrialba sp. SSL1]